MTKKELVAELAIRAEITKPEAGRVLDTFCDIVTETLARDEGVTMWDFGAFRMESRQARPGTNPHTGEYAPIHAKKIPVFVPGKILLDLSTIEEGGESSC